MINNIDFNNFENFKIASNTILDYLHENVGFSLWMMTRTVGNDWIVLQVKDNYYDVKEGDIFKWCDSFCSKMILGEGPFVAPDANKVDIYKNSEIAKYVEIGAYFGIPINNEDGSLFGTLCAIDPKAQNESITQHLPLVQILGKLLASMLVQDELNIKLNSKNTFLKENISILNENLKYLTLTENGQTIEVSNAFLNSIEKDKNEILNKSYDNFFNTSINFSELSNFIDTNGLYKNKLEGYTNNHKYYCYEFRIIKIAAFSKLDSKYLIVFSDISSKRELEDLQVKMVEQYKLAAMGEMIGNIAHQWRQPLSMIRTVSSGLRIQKELDALEDKELLEQLNKIEDTTTYLSDTIDVFRNFLKSDQEYENTSLKTIVNESIEILALMLKDYNIEIIKDYDEDKLKTSILKKQLPQVIINIITNAKDVLIERKIDNPWIKISIYKKSEKVMISIEDNAKGIDESIIHRIFEPYFTTKHSSLGTGLGLHMSYKIIKESLDGDISVENTSFGAKFIISLDLEDQ
jgi:nitrogen-specific signal transduction histidine kinase